MASEDKKKVVGLDTVWVFKDYIDKVREEIANNTDLSMKEYFNIKFKEEADKIKNNYDSQLIELNKRLDYVEQFGTPEEVEQIRLQLNALTTNTNDKFANLDKLNKDLEILSGEYEDIKNSVFTEGQINELINAAMIDGVTITNDTISSENIYASKLVAFIADFGKIKASQIEGGEITGHTIASSQYIPGTPDKKWQIGNEGEGWLANKQISWNENGDVTFGENVKIKWDNIDEKPEIPEGGLTESDVNNIISTTITKDYVESLEVRATDIIGDTITGKTIKSSDDEWEIQDGGTAKFANNRVCFNADGSGWIGKRDNGMAVLSWKKDGTIDASNTTMYDASNIFSGRMGVDAATLFTEGIFLCNGDVQLEKLGGITNRANLPAGVYTFVNVTADPITLTLPRFNNTSNRGLIITIPAFCGADIRFVYNSTGQFEFIPLVGATVEETFL